jgi:phospholipid transport system substrate-binding protein
MTIRRTLLLIIITAFTLSLFSVSIAAKTPTESVKFTVDAVLNIMRDKTLAVQEKKQERRDKMSALIRERFNFIEMSKRSLAKHWKKLTKEEKKEFVSIFSDLLEASYVGKVENYTDEKVTYNNEKIKGKGKYSVVNTTIVTKDVDIPIDYKLISKKDKWWVYDVVIEGVSFISTYRSQYNKIIMRESFPKLLENMRNKLKEIREQEEKG